MAKFTKHSLKRIEDIFKSAGYKVRYGKGNFKAGHCLFHDEKIILVNSFFAIDARISCLLDLVNLIPTGTLSESDVKFLNQFEKSHA